MSKNGRTMIELLQRMKERYQDEVGSDVSMESGAFADWLLKHGWRPPRPRTAKELLIRDIGRAMRAEYRRDEVGGFDYRANVAFRIFKEDGEQLTFWYDADRAPRRDVQKALMQRRNQIFGDVMGLANDRDHFNRVRGPTEGQIEITFDFNMDVEERRALQQQEQQQQRELAGDEDDEDDDKL